MEYGDFRTDPTANAAAMRATESIAADLGADDVASTIASNGIVVDVAAGVSANATVETDAAVEAARANGIPVEIDTVPYTLAELESRIRKLASDPWSAANGFPVAGVEADPSTGDLLVSLVQNTAAAAAAVAAHFGAGVDITAGNHPLGSLSSSSSDTYPWTGGDQIHDASYTCSSGFSFTSITNEYVSTAGHCYGLTPAYNASVSDSWYAAPFGQNNNLIANVVNDRSFWDGTHNVDYQMLPGLSSAYIWNGTSRLMVSYVAQQEPTNGLICFDGFVSGLQCGVQIVNGMPGCWNFPESGSTVTECQVVETYRSTLGYDQHGDSGGPVVTTLSGGQAEARGSIIAADGNNGWYLPTRYDESNTGLQAMVPINQTALAQLCLDDVAWSGTWVGNVTVINTCSQGNTGSQNFVWGPADETIHSRGLCLDVFGGGGLNTPVDEYTCNGTGSQQWIWQPYPGQSFPHAELYNPQSGMCLDDPTQSTTPGTHLQIHTCNGTVAQLWNLPDQYWTY